MESQSPPLYQIVNGKCYILLEDDLASREEGNLVMAIKLARAKIISIEKEMKTFEDDSEEYDELQDEKNDHEFMIADFENRFEILLNVPKY